MLAEFCQLFFELMILLDEACGPCGGFKRVRGFRGEDLTYVFPVL